MEIFRSHLVQEEILPFFPSNRGTVQRTKYFMKYLKSAYQYFKLETIESQAWHGKQLTRIQARLLTTTIDLKHLLKLWPKAVISSNWFQDVPLRNICLTILCITGFMDAYKWFHSRNSFLLDLAKQTGMFTQKSLRPIQSVECPVGYKSSVAMGTHL